MNEGQNAQESSDDKYVTLKSELAELLLGNDSPVTSEAAFKRDREMYAALIQQNVAHKEYIEKLQAVAPGLAQAETDLSDAQKRLKTQQNLLLNLAGELGKSTFRGLLTGGGMGTPTNVWALIGRYGDTHKCLGTDRLGIVSSVCVS